MHRFARLAGLTLAWWLAAAAGPASLGEEAFPVPASTRFT